MKLKLFPKHLGVWEGTYKRINPDGTLRDEWKSRLSVRFESEDFRKYHQVNEYMWSDGHYECHDFGVCEFNDDWELIFDNPRILGKAWETQNSIVLNWSYRDRPGSNLYEIIDLIGPKEEHRIRCWKWSTNDVFEGLTMIDEHKVKKVTEIDPKFWEDLPQNRTNGQPSRSDK